MVIGAVVEARSRRLGLQHGNCVSRAVFSSKGQACCDVLPNEDLPDEEMPATGQACQLIANMRDRICERIFANNEHRGTDINF